jgi:hypothetical protein
MLFWYYYSEAFEAHGIVSNVIEGNVSLYRHQQPLCEMYDKTPIFEETIL